MKKKLSGLTREHEALFNFVEGNKNICTKKEKQKAEYSSRWFLSIGMAKLMSHNVLDTVAKETG